MNKRAYIFVNGNYENLEFLKDLIKPNDFLIGCDGGADCIKTLGLAPALVCGDFDSIDVIPPEIHDLPADGSEIELSGTRYRRWPTDKDYLDTELAIDCALQSGSTEIRIVNSSGDELDHMIGTLFLLGKKKYEQKNLKIITPNQTISVKSGTIDISGAVGQKVSLIPMFGLVEVIKSRGLKYDPAGYEMRMGTNSGISNQLTDATAQIIVSKGSFLVVEHQRVAE